jgi:hypothetical protein
MDSVMEMKLELTVGDHVEDVPLILYVKSQVSVLVKSVKIKDAKLLRVRTEFKMVKRLILTVVLDATFVE